MLRGWQALMLSRGTPMMLMGDEYAHTKGGNNNTYGLDGACCASRGGACMPKALTGTRRCAQAL